jgi:hypothetical protein
MSNISKTILINISKTLSILENVFIGDKCSLEEIHMYTYFFKEFHDIFIRSYEKIPSIDPRIVKHEIHTYKNAKPIQ